VPSEKRARQRAFRAQKQAVIQRQRKRRATLRRVLTFGGLAAAIVLIVVLIQSGGSKHPHANGKNPSTTLKTGGSSTPTTASTTAPSTTPTSTFPVPTTQALTSVPVAPKCLTNPSTSRVVLFSTAPGDCIGKTSVWDATFETSVGNLTVQMDAAKSYAAVNNFVFLAEYQYFNGTFFHRIIPGFVIQGGDPAGTGSSGATGTGVMKYGYPGYQWTGNYPPQSCKTKVTAPCYHAGDIAMANSNPNPKTAPSASTNGSQFFLILKGGDTQLNSEPSYSDFGKVISGMSVVDKIGTYGSTQGAPTTRLYLLKVTVKQVKA
jgi:cyclophilin family peptidyl-prolyl cis-trans isomerase